MLDDNTIYWCSTCHFIQPSGFCCFCGEPVVKVQHKTCQKLGNWFVVCSAGHRRTNPQESIILGREDSHTAFLFSNNSFVSRQHALLESKSDGIAVKDLQSGNGTFVLQQNRHEEQKSWRRLQPDELVILKSGDPLLLSWENLCRVWLVWTPAFVAMEKVSLWKTASKRILLAGENNFKIGNAARIINNDGWHIIENLTDEPGMVVVNTQEVVSTILHHGDRIVVENQTYEYTPLQLVPASPFLPLQLTLNNIEMTKRLQIHEPIHWQSGQLTALVGHSGSGKSSLVGLLAGWAKAQVNWNITMGDSILSAEEMQKILVYLPQGDILYDNLTVTSSLFYTASLLSPELTLSEHKEKIRQTLQRVGLLDIQEKRVHSISGGQRRRVQIAQALLHEKAMILILDEPTSGLDLANDRNIMKILQRLARQCRTVICTTHHLGNIDLCDQVILLEQGKMKSQGTPTEIASDNHIPLGDIEWCSLYEQQSKPASTTLASCEIIPPKWLGNQPYSWWALLRRRIEEFCHPPASWLQVISQLLIIPFFIGLAIRIVWPLENGDEKRFFFCSVALFWLSISLSSQELQPGRYLRFAHELRYGRKKFPSLVAFILFYGLIGLIQTAVLISPSIVLTVRSQMLLLFGLLTWTLGLSGTLVGLNLGIMESWIKIPVSVTVPALTIMQLLFSELVMVLNSDSYFSFAWNEIRGMIYSVTFSRYVDMAYRACHNETIGIPGDFYYNLVLLFCYGFFMPLLVLAMCMKCIRPRE